MSRYLRGSTMLHDHYVPWLNKCDSIVGQLARGDLARSFSFLAAFEAGQSPHEAVQSAIERMEDGLYDRRRPQ
jgi:hypothetical protein